jgi:hypothetical protein
LEDEDEDDGEDGVVIRRSFESKYSGSSMVMGGLGLEMEMDWEFELEFEFLLKLVLFSVVGGICWFSFPRSRVAACSFSRPTVGDVRRAR